MDDETITIAEQAERCRRIARDMLDDDMRRSLEELACEYEELLRADGGDGSGSGQGFMLRE